MKHAKLKNFIVNVFHRSFVIYASATLLIFFWWMATLPLFFPRENGSFMPNTEEIPSKFTLSNTLSLPLNRESIRSALNGNQEAMCQLIEKWEEEAKKLKSLGVLDIVPIKDFRYDLIKSNLDNRLTSSCESIFPQSFAAAGISLALVDPQQIIAIPRGIRAQEEICPSEKSDKIPHSTDRFSHELLAYLSPEIGIVSTYSHPAIISLLKRLQIPCLTLPTPNTLENITDSIKQLGNAIESEVEADLLAYFFEAALHALDNRVRVLKYLEDGELNKNIAFVHYHVNLSIPTDNTLIGQLLQRAHINENFFIQKNHSHLWHVPIDYESLHQYAPDGLIIASSQQNIIRRLLTFFPKIRDTLAYKRGHVFVVNNGLNQTPTQHLILAYSDLIEALFQVYGYVD